MFKKPTYANEHLTPEAAKINTAIAGLGYRIGVLNYEISLDPGKNAGELDIVWQQLRAAIQDREKLQEAGQWYIN